MSRIKSISLYAAASALMVGAATYSTNAQLSAYSQDFEGLDPLNAGTAELGGDGWFVGANVFAADGTTFQYDYFAFPAPNLSGGFSNVTDVAGGALAGSQGLVVFSDYNNGDHGGTNRIEAVFFREQTIDASNVGETWEFSFLAGPGDLGGATTARAFIKTIDGSSTTNLLTQDTTSLSGTTSLAIQIDITSALIGQKLQIGFDNTASGFDPSGVNYDNINFDVVPEPSSLALIGLGAAALIRRRRR